MSATYLAWNGQSYPWPPPAGWYEAADGRWWAPGSGPEADPAGDVSTAGAPPDPTPSGPAATYPMTDDPSTTGPASADHRTQAAASYEVRAPGANPTEPKPSFDQGPRAGTPIPPVSTEARLSLSPSTETLSAPMDDQSTILTGHPTQHVGPPTGPDRVELAGGPAPGSTPPPGTGVWQPSSAGSNSRSQLPLVIAAVLAALVTAGVVVWAFGRNGGSADAELPTGAETAADSTDAADPGGRADDAAAQTGTDSSVETTSTTTTTASSTTTGVPTIDTLSDVEKVAEFRSILDEEGLSSDLLSDQDLIEFGTSFCVFAIAAENTDDYLRFRTEAIGQSDSELTEDELALAVDRAVSTFCPDDALRLGIRQ